MHVFELHYPGTWLTGLTDAIGRDVQSLLYVVESQLSDAGVGLELFDQARAKRLAQPSWIQGGGTVRALQIEMEGRLPPDLTPEQRFAAEETIRESAELQVKRQGWSSGRVPAAYSHRLPFIHAHTVLHALDGIGKSLSILADMDGLPREVAAAREGYVAALPDLVPVRDSAHHVEDRSRGVNHRQKLLTLQPVSNQMIHAPGGALIISALNNNNLGYTRSDGHYAEVEISAASVAIAQTAIQRTLDALSWRGSSRVVPD